MTTLSFQSELRPELSVNVANVYGAKDYRELCNTLIKMDEILIKSGLEHKLVIKAIERYLNGKDTSSISGRKASSLYSMMCHALRCNIARHLEGDSYRDFSIKLSDSALFQWFTKINDIGKTQAVSKSSLERYEKYFEAGLVEEIIRSFLGELSDENNAIKVGIYAPISCADVFADTTCIKSNIHFPVDWILLRDGARTLLLAIKLIREQGLRNRMIEPDQLLKQMNKLCIAMTHTRRKKEGKKQRKKILRLMKKLSNCIIKHGKSYRNLLGANWEQTALSEAQTKQIITRINLILEQLPRAIKQAHERIIGERPVASKDKILSLYDKDVHVIVRGKAGNEVEFGQGLLLVEQTDGLIVDWKLFKDQPPSDSKIVESIISRVEEHHGKIQSICGDRGFSSKNNDVLLKEKEIYNAVCPRSVKELQDKLLDPKFSSFQTRRSQTEARIGIFKNVFCGKPLRSKVTEYKIHAINWNILTHNLWVLSRKAINIEKQELKKAA